MNILAIDTSTKVASVAVKKDDKIIGKNISNEITHSEKLLPLVDQMLTISDTKLKSMDLLACTNGPGSFTGIRIGLATIKGFAHVTGKKIFAINSTLLLAIEDYYMNIQNLKKEKNQPIYICSLMDARNERVYFAVYLFNTVYDKLVVTNIIDVTNNYIDEALDKISDAIQNKDIPLAFCGDCIEHFGEKISEYFQNLKKEKIDNIQISKNNVFPDAKYIIKYIQNIQDPKKYICDYNTLDAVYARMSQAERVKKNEN